MTLKLQVIIICMVSALYLCIFWLAKKKELDLRYAFGWLLLGIVVLGLALCPKALRALSGAVGIASPVNMLFFFGFCLGMCIIFSLSMAVSHLNDKVKRLAQELAILRKQSYEWHKGEVGANEAGKMGEENGTAEKVE